MENTKKNQKENSPIIPPTRGLSSVDGFHCPFFQSVYLSAHIFRFLCAVLLVKSFCLRLPGFKDPNSKLNFPPAL